MSSNYLETEEKKWLKILPVKYNSSSRQTGFSWFPWSFPSSKKNSQSWKGKICSILTDATKIQSADACELLSATFFSGLLQDQEDNIAICHSCAFSQGKRKFKNDTSQFMPNKGNINTSFKHKISSKPKSKEGKEAECSISALGKKTHFLSLEDHFSSESWIPVSQLLKSCLCN